VAVAVALIRRVAAVAADIPAVVVADTEGAAAKTSFFFPTNYVSFFPIGPVSFSGDRAVFCHATKLHGVVIAMKPTWRDPGMCGQF
jgi:hypothetical protein